MNARELLAFNDRMVKEWNETHDTKLAREILALLDTHTPKQITTDPGAADCWWHICESMAEKISAQDPEGALRLLELARESNAKEGTYATGSGEGIVSVANVNRIERKMERLRKRNQPPPSKTCTCKRAFDTSKPLAHLVYEDLKGKVFTLTVGRCETCGTYWQAVASQPFPGALHEQAEAMRENEAQDLIVWIKSCPNPDNKSCACPAHQKIGW